MSASDTVGPGDGFDLDLATASLLADNHDVHLLLKALVNQLSGSFGDRLTVERKGGLLHKSDEIKRVAVSIGSEDFGAEVHGAGVACTIGHASGGIRIRTETIEMDEWLHRLLVALQAQAAHSQAARQALENIVIGGPA